MKRLHQLLAGLMAIAMVATMTVVPAFADGENPDSGDSQEKQEEKKEEGEEGGSGSAAEKTYTYSSDGYISDNAGITYLPVTAKYTVQFTTSSGLRPVGDFVYTLTPMDVADGLDDGSTSKNPIYDGLEFDTTDGTSSVEVIFDSEGTKTSGTTDTQIGKLPLTGLKTDSTTNGIYRYTLTQETKGKNTLGSDNVYADDENNKTTYTVDLIISKGTVIAVKVWTADASSKMTPVFENTVVNKDALVITHWIENDFKDADETFEFQVTIPEAGVEGGISLTAGTLIYGTITNVYGHPDRNVTFFVPKDGSNDTVLLDEEGNEIANNVVELFDGDKLDIPGLPAGMLYYVSMNNANDNNYASKFYDYATYTTKSSENHMAFTKNIDIVNDATEDTGTKLGGTMSGTEYTNSLDKVHHVEFVSMKSFTATGISMDSIPYAVMFVAAAAIAVLAVAKKKTNR
jgi:hypothetical protein